MNLQEAETYAKKIFSTKWIQWKHKGSKPANDKIEKTKNVLLANLSKKHCSTCLNLNECCFTIEKMPPIPLHPNCHCSVISIPPITATAECSIRKFTNYIFVSSAVNNKKELFELWGYDITDSEYLQNEFIKQAQIAYSIGDYELKSLDAFGQRINIKISLKKKGSNEYATFFSSWMIYPNGKIMLITPYGGKIK